MHTFSLLAVGCELLDGRVRDTNSEFISAKMLPLGLEPVMRIIVGDDIEHIKGALYLAVVASDAVIVTGGLGPTEDDLTREAVAEALGITLERSGQLEDGLRAFFAEMGREMSVTNLKQADLLSGATPLNARLGTAPGQWLEHEGTPIILLPGVPREMRDMIEGDVIPLLSQRFSLRRKVGPVTFTVAARPESELAEQLEEALAGTSGINVSYRAMMGQIEVRLSSRDRGKLADAEARVRKLLGPWVVAEGGETLEGNLGRELRSRGLTLSVAESVTGGMVGERLTRIAGSSDYFKGGITAYDYQAKESLLRVDRSLLESRGAVNEEVAEAMARGVRERLRADIGISVTGIAGPDSGGENEPVGTVAFGLADEERAHSWKYRLPGDREMVRQFASTIALTVAYMYVRGEDVTDVR